MSIDVRVRRVRQIVAWVVALSCLFIFLYSSETTVMLARKVLFLQFAPSAVEFLLNAGGVTAIGFLVVILLTLLFGRVYCACLCPLGVLQDGIRWFRRIVPKRPNDRYLQPQPLLRYGILLLVIFTTLTGSLVLLNLLDPYSLFGRLTTTLLLPIVTAGNNLLAAVLAWFDIYSVPMRTFPPVSLLLVGVMLVMFGVLTVMALFWGRQYCNTLCPVGTLLGLFSRFSLFQIRLNSTTCISCKRCERVCRSGCLDLANKQVDASRCVACFDCVAVCPNGSLSYRPALTAAQEVSMNPSRRTFLIGTASAAGVIALTGLSLRSFARSLLSWDVASQNQSQPLQDNLVPIVPPGAQSIARFVTSCTGCHLCVSVCPTHVLQPAHGRYGLQGVLQPGMDYLAGYCDYDCNRCGQVCPTSAIAPLSLAQKQLTQIGTVKLIEDRCIVYDRKEECGACVEVCPTHAVYGQEVDGLLHPHVKVEHCIGCGRCENVCPQNPRAIFVEGIREHAQAEPPFYVDRPVMEATTPQKSGDFPF